MCKKLVIVTGMHRSGTSGLAKSIVELGFDPGLNLMPGDSENPFGYFEDLGVYNLNETILSNLFLTWDKIEPFDDRRINIFRDEIYKQFSEAAIKLIKAKLDRSDRVIIKDPRFCILWPFWKKVIEEVDAEVNKFHIFRNPLSVAKSLNKRNRISIKNGLLLWYYNNIAAITDPGVSSFFVSYHHVLDNTDEVYNQIDKILQCKKTDSSPEIKGEFSASIDQTLDHNKFTDAQLIEQSSFLPEIFKLWNFLNQTTQHNGPENSQKLPAEYFVPKLSTLYDEDEEKRLNISFFSLGENEKPISKTVQIQHINHESKVEFRFGDQEEIKDFSLFLCDKPCIVSIKALNIFSGGDQLKINPIGGNYAHFDGNRYFFDNNSPCLNYAFEVNKNINSVVADIEIELINNENVASLIPVLKLKNRETQQQVQEQADQIMLLNKKISDQIPEITALKQ